MSETLLSYDEAAAQVAGYAAQLRRHPVPAERVALAAALQRTLAQAICTDQDQPPFARSTRDGYACRAAEAAARAWLPVAGATRAGQPPAGPLPPAEAWEIMTGAPVPAGADAVVMLEHVDAEPGRVRLHPARTLTTGDNIVAQGAQARAGQQLLAPGVLLGPAQIALAASCGYPQLDVYTRPRVAILATGDELVPIHATPTPGQIRNSNSPMLAALVATAGGDPWLLPAAADTAEALDEAFAQAIEADLLLVTGGVSAGKFDLVEPVLARLGARFHFTGARIQPGKPIVFGELPRTGQRTLPFFGLPGNPVSSAVTFLLFAAPVLAALAGRAETGPHFALARAASEIQLGAKSSLTRFLPAWCTFGTQGEPPQVSRVTWQGSGDLTALAHANCFLVAPEGVSSLPPGAAVRILLI